MTAKRSRSDSSTAAVAAMQAAAAGPLKPPSFVNIRKADKPFWDSIVRARARESWTDSDLVMAGNLARCLSDIERLQQEIDFEGDVILNDRKTQVINPKHSLLETLSRRAVALSRTLQVHAQATQGESRDQGKKATKQREAEKVLESQDDDDLIPRAVH
ncbi:TerS protein [Pseudomonas putida]|uniref:TerS protein n=1 Tax=Pseudomonas putida TaxID=303 RepID=A0A2S3WBB6_PSEPU|nr:TerS protein [Pseudomonas putida]POF88210.1 TerS protein [Pseudomonas putida]